SLFQLNWPNILILIGVIILFHLFKPRKKEAQHCYNTKESFETSTSENGFVKINDVFTSSKLIVLDPVFKGAQIRCSFAGTILDLRRTKLEDKETYIEIDCDFGGINILVPENWKIKTQMNTFVGSCDDKRFTDMTVIDAEHTLFIRGKLSFGGIELR
ncbi:MAG: LiaF domain-containing protein, partial [Parabacteroides sp.]